ncbi:MAG: BTAD domain-containing putative transcriptional regulator [Oscillospiraceae bacterium]
MKNQAEFASAYVSFLGGFRMEHGRNVLTDEINRSLKLWNVLCYLIIHRERSVPQSELIELFWTEDNSANPSNALKTLLYRLRAMLEPAFGPGVQPILSKHGSYRWNPQIKCELDIDTFESLCSNAASVPLADEKMAVYQSAMALYKGDFMPKLGGQLWAVPIAAHYHMLYLDAVKKFIELLCDFGRFDEMQEVCSRATEFEPLDEQLHIMTIKALLRQGKHSSALAHYEHATDLLYRNLGVKPSDELRKLYSQIMNEEKSLETDLEVIQNDLREAAKKPGAFICEYGFFKEAYRLEARRSSRSGQCVHVGLITVTNQQGGIPSQAVLNTTMDQLQEILIKCLRCGDVVAKYSAAQFVLLLPAANYEDSLMIMNRIVTAFHRHYRLNFQKLSCKVRELELY